MSRRQFLRFASCLFAALAPAAASGGIAVGEPQLPDLIAWASESKCYMYCGELNANIVPGKVVYRFVGALANIGPGKLEVREFTHPNDTQDVYQRIYDSEGGFVESLIGSFPDAAPTPPRHLWLPGIAQYKFREVTAGGGVGEVLSFNDKTSMAVVDSAAYDKNLPGAPPVAFYNSVSAAILGISIGYADVYGINFAGQWADATGLASGTYWLEVTVNPYGDSPEGRVIEADYANNSTRILVDLLPGDYNDDGAVDAADYTVWRNTLGTSVEVATTGADGDGNGMVELADYSVWKNNYGESMPGVGNGGLADELPIAVPEPSAAALLFVASVAFVACRRQRLA